MYLIFQDYANPLTRFAMQDYPEDGGKGMTQVFNGTKMLLDLPSPPAVRVDGMIYFVNELLKDSSGAYFIPERFFLGSPTVEGRVEGPEQSDGKILYALGRAAQPTDVSVFRCVLYYFKRFDRQDSLLMTNRKSSQLRCLHGHMKIFHQRMSSTVDSLVR